MGGLSEQKESGACRHEDGDYCQGLEPFRQIGGEVEFAGRKEAAAEKGDAQNLLKEV